MRTRRGLVLVYDDDADLLTTIADLLDLLEYTVIGTTALIHPRDLVFRGTPDLVILDVMLAGDMSGIEVGPALRKRGVTCPIVVMSASPMLADMARESEQFAHVFDKPFELTEFQAVLSTLLPQP